MLHRVLLSSLLVALSGCGDGFVIGDAHMADAGPDEGEESDGDTSLDQTLALYAKEVAGEWQVTTFDNPVPGKVILTPSEQQPRNGTTELVSDCSASSCPPDDIGRPRMMGPTDRRSGEYWFVKLKGPNALVILDGAFADVPVSCLYLRAMKKIDCVLFAFSRVQSF